MQYMGTPNMLETVASDIIDIGEVDRNMGDVIHSGLTYADMNSFARLLCYKFRLVIIYQNSFSLRCTS